MASHTGDKIGNAFLTEPGLLKPCRLTTALQLRSNTAANRTALNRAVPQADLMCRKCRVQLETLPHILGQCEQTKGSRIRRHDEMKEFIEAHILNGKRGERTVTTEAELRAPDGKRLKPDLLVKSGEGVFVVDVTVRCEDGDSLRHAALSKLNTYQPLLPSVAALYQSNDAEVLPVVVGTTEAMPKDTIDALRKIGIRNKGDLKTISLIALRSSIELHHHFMDYDGAV